MLEQQAAKYRLDARAEVAVAAQEGLSGGIGDAGTSFGPWQLHEGGAYPASAPHGSPEAANKWAWSPAGVEYAESRMESVAGGKHGDAAIEAIVTGFERPAAPAAEIKAAEAWYHGAGNLPAGTGGPGSPAASTGGGVSVQPASLLGTPVGTTEALAIRLAFAALGVALLVVALILISRATTRRTVIAGVGGFLAGERAGARSSSTSSSSERADDEARGRAVREQAAREDAGVPPRLRRRDPGPAERPARRRGSRR
jgi:hypothetical protein